MKRIILRTHDYDTKLEDITISPNSDNNSFNEHDCRKMIKALIESEEVRSIHPFVSGKSGVETSRDPFYSEKKQNDLALNKDFFEQKYNKDEKYPYYGIKGLIGTIRNVIEYDVKNKYGEKEGTEEIDLTLEVRSRFDTLDRPWFAAAMLSTIVEDSEGIASQSEIYNGEMDIFGFIKAVLFAKYLERAYKAGIYRPYVRNEYNNSRPRGSLDIARHLRLNLARKDRVAYVTRERDENNPLNRLIMHTWRYLKSKFPAVSGALDKNTLHRALGELQAYTASSNDSVSKCVMQNLHPITGPYYTDYEKLRKLCLSILRDENVNANIYGDTAADEFAHGITFYVPDLWEMYLERFLPAKGLKCQDKLRYYQAFDNVCNEKDGIMKVLKENYPTIIPTIRPDFVYYNKEEKPIFILDAKFRVYEKEKEMLDDLKKLRRDMAIYTLAFFPPKLKGGLILPISEGHKGVVGEIFKGVDEGVRLDTKFFMVKVPANNGDKDYSDWCKAFEESIKKTVKRFERWVR